MTDGVIVDPWPGGRWKADLRRRLGAWYRRQARDLPWRADRDPYRVWVSEIMLQQTTVATVRGYFTRFMEALPTIAALAAADEQAVLRLWEGLGYYRRARQLHRAAQVMVAEHDGRIPNDREAVRRLPGVGRYTAGAILSIAFDRSEPILEANTVRLLARLLALRGDTARSDAQRLLWLAAEKLLPPRRGAGQFNQALMELGSQVCRPRDPLCLICPLAELCPTRRDGLQNEIPAPKRKTVFEETREAAVVAWRRGQVLLVRRRDGERWAGLWDFPRVTCDATDASPGDDELEMKVLAQTGVSIGGLAPLTTLRHGVTRFRITLECFTAQARAKAARTNSHAEIKWVRPADLGEYPLNSTGRKIADLITAQPTSPRHPAAPSRCLLKRVGNTNPR